MAGTLLLEYRRLGKKEISATIIVRPPSCMNSSFSGWQEEEFRPSELLPPLS